MAMLLMTLMPLTPRTTQMFAFYVTFHIFVVGERTDFKSGTHVDSSRLQPNEDKQSLKRT